MKITVSDERLACLAQMGDKRATELLLNKYKPFVRRRCKHYYMAGGTSEDILQEGMIGLYRAIMNFSLEKNNSFAAFASMCIKRRLINALETANRKKNQPLNNYVSLNNPVHENGVTLADVLEDFTQDPESMYIKSENQQNAGLTLQKILSSLEKRILIKYIQGKSYEKIAQETGVSRKSVDNAMQRIRQKLSKIKI